MSAGYFIGCGKEPSVYDGEHIRAELNMSALKSRRLQAKFSEYHWKKKQ
ncbi:MAG: hypothetical protein ACU4EQ_05445 [Candidatus Nitrosoglobus sp.]|jgi:hypothetical protein